MSLAAWAVAERGLSDASASIARVKAPPKRTLTAVADQKLAPEPR